MAVVAQGEGAPVAILNRNKPAFYAVPADVYEEIIDVLEDMELAAIVESRKGQPTIKVHINDL